MKTAVFLFPFLLLLASPATFPAGAQPPPPTNQSSQYSYNEFNPAVAGILIILTLALVFMTFVSAYIRFLSESPADAGDVHGELSLRLRRAAAARGLDPSVLESFPTFSYSEVKCHKIGKSDLECAVCLNEFEDDEILRLLPRCDHVFHPECIDAWLVSHVTCPVCRANLSLTPAAEDKDQDQDHLPHSSPASGDVAVQVVEDDDRSEQPTSLPSGRSMRVPKAGSFGKLGKFRSHSTGHSMVLPGENLERFTLRLPVRLRKEVMDRALSNRIGEGSWSRARFFKRIGRSSGRWGFSTRASSMRLSKVSDEPPDHAGILLSFKNIK